LAKPIAAFADDDDEEEAAAEEEPPSSADPAMNSGKRLLPQEKAKLEEP